VLPYEYEYRANAKGRWFGRTLLDVFVTEFADLSPDYYVRPPEQPRAHTHIRARGKREGDREREAGRQTRTHIRMCTCVQMYNVH
jgi:hypothetical protein